LVAVATHSHGVYTTNITSKNDVVSVNQVAGSKFQVSVYPNPSNGIFTISISQPELVSGSQMSQTLNLIQGMVQHDIAIYNVRGEKVYSSIINSQSSIINLDAPNGIYYCVLKSGEAVETRKIVVVK
jgi:hypothetical protein